MAALRRIRDILFFAVARPLLFAFWALVLWGTVMAVALSWAVVSRGPAATIESLLGGPGGLGGLNLALAVLAVAVWAVVLVLVVRGPRRDDD